jgi:polyhydroxyalkanoate synthesis regulator phasin
MIKDLRSRLQIERKKRMKQFDAGMKQFQSRFKKERKVVGRRLDDAMLATLAALNIPSRREVSELTGKVETLSRKIDSFRR